MDQIYKLQDQISFYHGSIARAAGDPYQLPQTKLGDLIGDFSTKS